MHKLLYGTVLLLVSAFPVEGQEPPQMEKPIEQHEWLMKFVGKWETESKAKMAPGQPDVDCNGTMSSKSVGKFWIVTDIKSSLLGHEFTGVQTLGYDPKLKKYVGTWVDSHNSHMWKYEGTVSKDGSTLTLNATGPNMSVPGTEATYRDIYEFKSNDELVIRSEMEVEDGKWMTFMSGHGKRKK